MGGFRKIKIEVTLDKWQAIKIVLNRVLNERALKIKKSLLVKKHKVLCFFGSPCFKSSFELLDIMRKKRASLDLATPGECKSRLIIPLIENVALPRFFSLYGTYYKVTSEYVGVRNKTESLRLVVCAGEYNQLFGGAKTSEQVCEYLLTSGWHEITKEEYRRGTE